MGNQTPSHPPHDDSADWEAIARYFAGESSSDEAMVVRRWLEAHPTEAAALTALGDATADLSSATPPDLDVEAALASVTRRRLAEDQAGAADVIPIDSRRPARRTPVRTDAPAKPAVPARRWQRFAVPAAAAAVLLIGGRLFWHSTRIGVYTNPPAAAQDVRDRRGPAGFGATDGRNARGSRSGESAYRGGRIRRQRARSRAEG
jgi:hypothetical protein